ncbi:MAG TPA: class I SAM-dependent methyltransferase [Acidimicrobiales bacterium]|jgi:SAM-dependent methyltransferase|nr:class I SAM-dependent methyltransferase [Acidimicrobiales bacterium]
MADSTFHTGRHRQTTAELDAAEQEWWERNWDLEERYCWVQTRGVQRLLRSAYTRRITGRLTRDDVVVELGSGTGWLSDLMRRRAGTVIGIDPSPSQISRSQQDPDEQAPRAGTDFRVGSYESLSEVPPPSVIVAHAVLHHLSSAEIDDCLRGCAAALSPGGRLVLFEPVAAPASPNASRSYSAQRRLEDLPHSFAARGWRRLSAEESALRRRLSDRPAQPLPFGPSPKETPLVRGELESHLHRHGFSVECMRPYLVMSHLVAQEMLIAETSQPRFWKLAKWPILAASVVLDQTMIRSGRLPAGAWVFTLFECQLVAGSVEVPRAG